jgi:hypothetical protein
VAVSDVRTRSPSALFNVSSTWPDFPQIDPLPDAFLQELYGAAERGEVCDVAIRHVMFTVTDPFSFSLTANLFCSAAAASIPKREHLFVALDEKSHKRLSQLGANVLLFEDGTNRPYLKFLIQYQLLLWNFESTLCDPDTIFLGRIAEIGTSWSHVVAASTGTSTEFNSRFDYTAFDLGFMRVSPAHITLQVYSAWLKTLTEATGEGPATILRKMIGPRRLRDRGGGGEQVYDLASRDVRSSELRVTWLDPLEVVNCLLLDQRMSAMRAAAKARKMDHPTVVRLTGIGPADKQMVIQARDLLFYDGSRCVPRRARQGFW